MRGKQNQRVLQERKMAQAGRLPPGQSLTLKFPVLHVGPTPLYEDLNDWSFRIFGDVEKEVCLNWEAFQAIPRTKIKMDVHCVTRWSKFDTEWEGVSVQTLLDSEIACLKPTASFLVQHCEYGFTVNLPLSVALADNFLLATHFNGHSLDPDHGYPLRGVIGHIPGRDNLNTPYLWKGGKWLRGLELLSADRLGYWEQIGFHNRADVWKEQRFSDVQNHI